MSPQSQVTWQSVKAAAPALRLRVEVADVSGAADVERAFDEMRPRFSAVFGFNDSLVFAHQRLIAKLAMRHRLPSVFYWREAVEADALASYGVNLKSRPREAAVFVDKILRGAKPGELPIEQRPSMNWSSTSRPRRPWG